MSLLSGKKILLGVTAGIAAYKTANLVRLFINKIKIRFREHLYCKGGLA